MLLQVGQWRVWIKGRDNDKEERKEGSVVWVRSPFILECGRVGGVTKSECDATHSSFLGTTPIHRPIANFVPFLPCLSICLVPPAHNCAYTCVHPLLFLKTPSTPKGRCLALPLSFSFLTIRRWLSRCDRRDGGAKGKRCLYSKVDRWLPFVWNQISTICSAWFFALNSCSRMKMLNLSCLGWKGYF